MERSLSDEARVTMARVADDEAELLLDLAEVAIRARLDGSWFPGPDARALPEALLRPCSAFVTLHVAGELNGCIGTLESDDPIGVCVGRLAIQAAFEDPRLPPLRRTDVAHLQIEVSLLSTRVPVPAGSRQELLAHLEPHEHGLLIVSGPHHAVFLPAVWEQLPEPDHFVDQLLRKAGLPIDRWPADLQAEVFTSTSVGRHLGESG